MQGKCGRRALYESPVRELDSNWAMAETDSDNLELAIEHGNVCKSATAYVKENVAFFATELIAKQRG
jgi:hypothetical protein